MVRRFPLLRGASKSDRFWRQNMNSRDHAQVWESFCGFYRRSTSGEIGLVHDPSSRSSIPYPFDSLAVLKQRIVDKFECRKPLRRRRHICEEGEREVIV